MSVDVRQVAGPSPQRLAAAFRRGGKQVPAAIRRGFQRALEPLDEAVKAQARKKFPSGYAPTFTASAVTKISIRSSGSTVNAEARIYAPGKAQRRLVTDLNRGVLRHPVFGRYRATRRGRMTSPWVVQSIPAGFADDAVEQTRPGISKAMAGVLDDIEQTLTGA